MDKQIDVKKSKTKWWLLAGGAILLGVLLQSFNAQSGSSVNIDRNKLRITAAFSGVFKDAIPIRGNITPKKTIYLDAIEGGRVEKILVEEGVMVTAGQPLLELSNTSLQLDVISREAQISEQLNNLHNTRLAIEQNRLSLKRELIELDYQIAQAKRKLNQMNKLLSKNIVAIDEQKSSSDHYHYLVKRRALTIEQQRQDEEIRSTQIAQLEDSVAQLNKNLKFARKNLENLIVKAPANGQLTSFNAELGESKTRGERLGQVDIVNSYKVVAKVDEFYLTRVLSGQMASFRLQGKEYGLILSKVYAQVSQGQFEVDFNFSNEIPKSLRRGQSLQIDLSLGQAKQAVLIPNGGFYQDTGGKWIFVIDENTEIASRRTIKIGQRNSEYIEVLAGLTAGEQVISSSYGPLAKIQQIKIK